MDKHYAKKRSDFVATHLREPTPEEDRGLRDAAREAARQEVAERHEADLRRAYLAQPGASPEAWEKERAGILAKDREQRTLASQNQARASQGSLYRSF